MESATSNRNNVQAGVLPEATLDLETLALPSNGSGRNLVTILSIAVVVFDPKAVNTFDELRCADMKDGAETSVFYAPVSLSESMERGFDSDVSTIKFWAKNARDPKSYNMLADAAASVERMSDTFTRLTEFLARHKVSRLWAKSPTFDCVSLREAFNHLNMTLPISWWAERDVRTLMDLGDVRLPFPEGFVIHHALHDAAFEAMQVQEFNRKKRGVEERLEKLAFLEQGFCYITSGCTPAKIDGVWQWTKEPSLNAVPLDKTTRKPRVSKR